MHKINLIEQTRINNEKNIINKTESNQPLKVIDKIVAFLKSNKHPLSQA